ncbi:unnamed protein product [Parascedosporium putredinis]|uniref:PRP1 splicing factor N-terminal domain-containing protein n=1 Tax=Parascedosporium putredinis TaxID=1442378 RepID=A0A9P1H499_9PEZI|nr:unnamed protein product [Parascedosporium putredinis]CAI7995459.1 unnamed protein product [Parascedosporium putredinis]
MFVSSRFDPWLRIANISLEQKSISRFDSCTEIEERGYAELTDTNDDKRSVSSVLEEPPPERESKNKNTDTIMASRRDFLNQPAPENYVAGLGRGATGFTTRSDLGPARDGPSDDQIKEIVAKRAAALGIGPDGKKRGDDEGGNDSERYQDPDNEVGLFAGGIYDKDDEEADQIWQWVDEKMAKRRKAQREAREAAETAEYERQNPKIQAQFADLKRALGTVSDEEWASLPEVGDLTGKNRRAKQALRQKFYAVPDSVLAAANDSSQMTTTVADDGTASGADAADGTMTNFAKIGAARDKVLKVRLDQASQGGGGGGGGGGSGTESTVGTATSIDPQGYITSLNRRSLTEAQAQVGDINRVRELLQSVIKTNPGNPLGWIAAARLEELAGKIVTARKVIAEGCKNRPKSEDVWLENIRLNEGQNAKVIAAEAIRHNSRSVRLWVEAMKLENIPSAKKRVIRQALDHLPDSEILWKEAVNLEEDVDNAKILLAKATELIPLSVLNRARKAVPTSYEIWIAAARLQEQLGEGTKVNVMKRAVQVLAKESAMPKREEWIAEAEKCEQEGAIITCGNIIRETLGWSLDEDDDRKDTWMKDAKSSIARGMYETARAIYSYALRVFVNSRTLWMEAADLERHHGSKQSLWDVLEKAVEACPKSEVLWMMLAKEKWQAGEINSARHVLARAFKQNPNNEDIWLAAVKLEAENEQVDEARKLLELAREQAPTDRVWMKSVVFERVLGNQEAALALVLKALQYFPGAAKLWMLKGQIYEDMGMIPQARRRTPRAVLDRARLAVPKSAELWLESVRVERRSGNGNQARSVMAKALQEVPRSGILWSEQIWFLEPRTQRRPRSLEAIKKVDSDPILFVASWFEKALVLDSDNGDTWAWYYKFLLQHGTEAKRGEVISKCILNEPRHGEYWQRIAKDPTNARKGIEDILKLTAAALEG